MQRNFIGRNRATRTQTHPLNTIDERQSSVHLLRFVRPFRTPGHLPDNTPQDTQFTD